MTNDEFNFLETPAIKNHKINSLETLAIKNHKTNSLETPTIKSTHNSKRTSDLEQTIISHEDEKAALVLFNWNIYNMVHFSMKVGHQFNNKDLLEETFFVWGTC